MKKNSCQHTEKVLRYRLGLLNTSEVRDVEEHLKGCDVCQRELQLESAIEKELAMELNPGIIEDRLRDCIMVRSVMDMRSFWLYTVRAIAYGIVAAIFGLSSIPMILKFLFKEHINIAAYTGRFSELIVRAFGSANTPLLITGLGIVFLVASSIYSLAYVRK